MTLPRTPRRRSGFTLVELLTVIGIISLLISILLPSLSRARDQAKKVTCKAELDAIGKGLEMFQNESNQYPDSSAGQDPIKWSKTWPLTNPLPQPTDDLELTGAHWLARAMIGHDFQGIDNNAVMLKRPPSTGWPANAQPLLDDFNRSTTPPGQYSERKAETGYVDPKVFVRDDDPLKFPGGTMGTGPITGRIVVSDVYNFPILYYRASRAQLPFDFGTYSSSTVKAGTSRGVYSQLDNAKWTGSDANNINSYDFAAAGAAHGLGKFIEGGTNTIPADYTGNNLPNLDRTASGNGTTQNGSVPYKGKTFAGYLHSENTHTSGNAAAPNNPESFILISPGKDGIYGTPDDVTNFTSGL